jgi:hypothetical protein
VTSRTWRRLGWGIALLALAALLPSVLSVWVDAEGRTWITDRGEAPSPDARRVLPDDLALTWGGDVLGDPLGPGTASVDERDRYLAAVFSARDDIRAGEMARGLEELQRLWREHPSRPEAGYLLALVERHRGRLEEAYQVLEAVLNTGADLEPAWGDTAMRLREELRGEIELARGSGQTSWEERSHETPHFRLVYDHQFAGRPYGLRVGRMLEQVRAHMLDVLGMELDRVLEVRLYTKAHYLTSYKHRFGFATVGFYDGTIHVVSARRPRDELYALLVHEYGHALFKEALGGHQPFFLNEGICDREEERVRGRKHIPRGEWRQLLEALRDDQWIPLASLVEGFAGLEGKRALLAYLESRAAVELIETRHPGAIARWLRRCSQGEPWEPALAAETGWDTNALEQALQAEVRSRFPPLDEAGLQAVGQGPTDIGPRDDVPRVRSEP